MVVLISYFVVRLIVGIVLIFWLYKIMFWGFMLYLLRKDCYVVLMFVYKFFFEGFFELFLYFE